MQTYLILKSEGIDVTCSTDFREQAINIAHFLQVEQADCHSNAFIVCLRVDYPRHPLANVHIVQNQSQAGKSAFWMPHWPPTDLVGRDPCRNKVVRVASMGIPWLSAGKRMDWQSELLKHGFEFEYLVERGNWNDLRDVDVLLAIRSFDKNPHNGKPAWKLVNAWLARIPLIAGHDSAYKQIGVPGEDYLLANSLNAAVNAVCRLRDDPLYYQRIVQKGLNKSQFYSRDATVERWRKLIYEELAPRYVAWNSSRIRRSLQRGLRSTKGRIRQVLRRCRCLLQGARSP